MSTYRRHTWADERLLVKDSPINGRGVFCERDIQEGETLMIWGGILVAKAGFDANAYRPQSVVPISDEHYLALPLSEGGPAIDEFLNHSCDPSAWLIDEVTVVARRDLRAGEEITLEFATWDDGLGNEYAEGGQCTCGSAGCRGVLRSDDYRLPELVRRYHGHFSPYLARRLESGE